MPIRAELQQPGRSVEVLESVKTEIGERRPVEERRSRFGEDDLAAVRQGGDSGAAVDVDADVPLGCQRGRARVQPHPNPDRSRLERTPALFGRSDRTRRGRERDEERVALRVDLDAVVGSERGAEHAPVLGQSLGVRVGPERMKQPRRALDVGEEERDRAARELSAHRCSW